MIMVLVSLKDVCVLDLAEQIVGRLRSRINEDLVHANVFSSTPVQFLLILHILLGYKLQSAVYVAMVFE